MDKEFWRAQRILQCVSFLCFLCRSHDSGRTIDDDRVTTKHVYDLAWSPDSEFLIAGSTDNTASIWKAGTGESPSSGLLERMSTDGQANAYMPCENTNITSKEYPGTP